MKFFIIFYFTVLIQSCVTYKNTTLNNSLGNHTDRCSNISNRHPNSAISCDDVLKKLTNETEKNQFTDQFTNQLADQFGDARKKITSKLKLATELLPSSLRDSFWDTVVQLSDNNDSKIKLLSHKIILTKKLNESIKIHSTYEYNTDSNSFNISKIEYSKPGKKPKLISDSPLNSETGQLKENIFLEINDPDLLNNTIQITEKVNYDVYEKILDEMDNLNLFTSFELTQLYKLKPAVRTLKYAAIATSRKIKGRLIDNIIKDYLIAPIRTLTISVVSLFAYAHSDLIKSTLETSHETPVWVAPTVVKMATRYPESVQPELISLMKVISNQSKSESLNEKTKSELIKKSPKNLKIDETDQFSIRYDLKNKKTYFFVTHEKETGQVEVYSTEINSSQYPQLIKYFNLEIK